MFGSAYGLATWTASKVGRGDVYANGRAVKQIRRAQSTEKAVRGSEVLLDILCVVQVRVSLAVRRQRLQGRPLLGNTYPVGYAGADKYGNVCARVKAAGWPPLVLERAGRSVEDLETVRSRDNTDANVCGGQELFLLKVVVETQFIHCIH